MELIDIRIFIISSIFFLFFAILWNFFMLIGALYLFRQKNFLYTKKFFYYIIYGAFVLILVDRGLSYLTGNIQFFKNIIQINGVSFNLIIIGLTIIILTIVHYFLLSLVLDFDNKTFLAALVLGIFNAPWYLINPWLIILPMTFLVVAYLTGRKSIS